MADNATLEGALQYEETMLEQANVLLDYFKKRAEIEHAYSKSLTELSNATQSSMDALAAKIVGGSANTGTQGRGGIFAKLTKDNRKASMSDLSREVGATTIGSTMSAGLADVFSDSGRDAARHEECSRQLKTAVIPKCNEYLKALHGQLKDISAHKHQSVASTKGTPIMFVRGQLNASVAAPSVATSGFVQETQMSQVLQRLAQYEQSRYAFCFGAHSDPDRPHFLFPAS